MWAGAPTHVDGWVVISDLQRVGTGSQTLERTTRSGVGECTHANDQRLGQQGGGE